MVIWSYLLYFFPPLIPGESRGEIAGRRSRTACVASVVLVLWLCRTFLTPSIHRLRGLPIGLVPDSWLLYERRAGWSGGIRIRCPNQLRRCFSICWRIGLVPTVSLITSFLILSRLVLFAALRRHFISQGYSTWVQSCDWPKKSRKITWTIE